MDTINLIGKGPGAVLLLHGLYGTPQQLQYIGRKLNVVGGYTVRIPNIQGYSVFDEAIPSHTTRWQHWLEQVEAQFDGLKREHGEVSVAGLCIGADLCLELAAKRSPDIHALCLYSAPLRYDGWNVTWMRWFKFLGYYTPARFMMSLTERPPYGLKDERIRQWVARQMAERGTSALGSSYSPLTGVFESERLMKDVRQKLHKISAPTLIMHAIEDDLASPRNADIIEKSVSSPQVKKVLLENCYHIITMDFQKERVAQETLEFIRQSTVQIVQDAQPPLQRVG
ncbi:MAG: alpha/beta hydrolase [Betaproteobacteria bacterium]|nr:alpha/beta hydrolase [Betaproteobacteria bacterium]